MPPKLNYSTRRKKANPQQEEISNQEVEERKIKEMVDGKNRPKQ